MSVELSVIKRINRLPAIADQVKPQVAVILNKAIDDVSVHADPRTPVDRGFLKANKRRIYATPGHLEARLHWLQHYAAYQEFGTVRGVAPKRFARDSFEEVAPSVEAAIRTVVGGA